MNTLYNRSLSYYCYKGRTDAEKDGEMRREGEQSNLAMGSGIVATWCSGKIVIFHNSLQPLPRLHRCALNTMRVVIFLYNQ